MGTFSRIKKEYGIEPKGTKETAPKATSGGTARPSSGSFAAMKERYGVGTTPTPVGSGLDGVSRANAAIAQTQRELSDIQDQIDAREAGLDLDGAAHLYNTDYAAKKRQLEDQEAALERAIASTPTGQLLAQRKQQQSELTAGLDLDGASALQSEIDRLENMSKMERHAGQIYEDDFSGQFGASMASGRLQQEAAKAWGDYAANPTQENRMRAQAMSDILTQLHTDNAQTLDDDATLPWVSQTLAGHLSQFWDQTKARVGGALTGGALAAMTPWTAPFAGKAAKVGATVATGLQSYQVMRGQAFKELLDLGVDEETARKASNDEAVISSMIEMAETGVDMFVGLGSLLKGGKVVTQAAKPAAKRLLSLLGKYGLNTGTEWLEEGGQQGVSIANRENALQGETGKGKLFGRTLDVLLDAVTGKDKDAAQEIVAAGNEGAKIAAMMGLPGMAGNVAMSTVANRNPQMTQEQISQSTEHVDAPGTPPATPAPVTAPSASNDIATELVSAGATEAEAETLAPLLSAVLNGEEISGNQAGTIAKNEVAVSILENATGETINTDAPLGEVKSAICGLASRHSAQAEQTATEDTPAQMRPVEAAQAPVEPSVVESPAVEDFTQRNAQAVSDFAKTVDKAGATVLTEMYSEGQDTEQYIAGMMRAYNAGKNGTSRAEIINNLQGINGHQAQAAYIAGQSDAMRTEQAVYFGKDAGLVEDPMLKRANLRSKDRRMLDAVGKVAGVKVRFADKLTDKDGRPANAQYSNGELLIALNTADPVRVAFAHEIVHRMREVSPEAYNALATFVQQNMNSDSMAVVQRAYSDAYGTNPDVLSEEIVAQAFGQMLGDSAVLEQFVKDDRNAAQKLLDAVHDLIAAIKRALNGQNVKLTSEQKADFTDLQGNLEGMSKVLEHSLKHMGLDVQRNTKEGNKNTASEGGEVKYSLNKNFAAEVDAWDGKKNTVFRIGTTSEALRSIGVQDRGIVWYGKKIAEILRKHSNMSKEIIKQVPEILEHPVVVLKSQQSDSRIVVFGELKDDNGDLVTAVLELAPTNKGGELLDMNVVVSAYGKDTNPASFIQNSELLYLDKNRTESWMNAVGLQLPSVAPAFGSIGTITYQNGKVKIVGVPYKQYMANASNNAGRDNSKNSLVVARSKAAESLSRELASIREEGARTGKDAAEIELEVQQAIKRSYDTLIDKYGAIPAGENPARDVQVPKKTADNQKVSQTVRTILEAKATPDAAVPTIEELTAMGDFSYEVYTDKQAMTDADNTIRDKGYNTALIEWTKSVQEGEVSKGNTALGWALYNQAANAGDLKTAMSILTNMVGHQRNAAQAVQATRILKKMSPEAQLYGVQRSAQNLAEDLKKRYGKDAPDIQVNEELARKYLEAETDKEREEAMRNLYRDLGRQMPSRFIDKWNAWRYLAMLGNPRTHVRNVLGNAFFAPVVFAKDMTATAIESAVSRVSGGKLDRTKGVVGFGKQGRELLSAAWSDYESVADQVSSGGKYSDLDHSNQYIQEGRRIFKNRALEAARKGNSAALEAEDMWFSRPHYAYALAQYCKANGITPEMLRVANGGQKKTATKGGKITVESTEQERFDLLKDRTITVPEYDPKRAAEIEQADYAALEKIGRGGAFTILRKIGEQFGVFKDYHNADMEIDFGFSKRNLQESISKQNGEYQNYAKMLSVFDDVVKNAVGIEMHRDERYQKPDSNIEATYVFLSAFQTETGILPVRLEVREFSDGKTKSGLHVAISLTEIERSRIMEATPTSKADEPTSLPASYTFKIADILKNVNAKDGALLKYVPDDFLNTQQKEAKREAIREESEYNARKDEARAAKKGAVKFSLSTAERPALQPKAPFVDRVLLDRARAYAIKEAQKATYRDTNVLSSFLSRRFSERGEYGKAGKVGNMALEGILPFRKTPANILARGLEYSPLGLGNGIKQAVKDVKRGTKTAAEAVDSISAGLTGTGLLALGWFLAAQGLVRGSGGDDEEKNEFEELQGHQAYALELPDGTSVTLDWLAPEVLPFFVGVNLWEQAASKDDGGVTMSDILTATANVTEPLLEMSCLQSLNDVFDAVGYASSDGLSPLPSALASAATSYLTQGFPTLLGQAERTGEDRRMTTYTEKNAFLTPDMQYTVGRISARLPGWDYQQIPYIDAWGRTENTGNAAERAGNNFLNPAYTSTAETSPMEDELLRLYEQTGDGGVLPSRAAKYFNVDGERKDLTAQEYVKYAQAKGQTAYKVLTALSGSEAYRKMSDAEKVEAVGLVYDYANATAKTKVSGYKPEGWIAKAVKTEKATGVKAEQYVTLYLAQKDIESLKEADGDTIANSKSLLVMEMVYNVKGLTDAQRRALFEDFGVGKTVIHWNKALVQEKLKALRKKAA